MKKWLVLLLIPLFFSCENGLNSNGVVGSSGGLYTETGTTSNNNSNKWKCYLENSLSNGTYKNSYLLLDITSSNEGQLCYFKNDKLENFVNFEYKLKDNKIEFKNCTLRVYPRTYEFSDGEIFGNIIKVVYGKIEGIDQFFLFYRE